MPKYFSQPLAVPPVLSPTDRQTIRCFDAQMREYDHFDLARTFGVASILPGFKTPVFGCNGVVPGPTINVHHDNPIVANQSNLLHLSSCRVRSSATSTRTAKGARTLSYHDHGGPWRRWGA